VPDDFFLTNLLYVTESICLFKDYCVEVHSLVLESCIISNLTILLAFPTDPSVLGFA
jgi:hypothetical protein